MLGKSTASNPRPLRRQVVRDVISCRPASSKVVIRNSVGEIARRSRGAAKSPGRGPGSSTRKIDNFLPSRLGPGIVFQKGRQARLGLLMGDLRLGLRVYGQGMDREWCRKPLKSLKTDSEKAPGSRSFRRRMDLANSVSLAQTRRLCRGVDRLLAPGRIEHLARRSGRAGSDSGRDVDRAIGESAERFDQTALCV